MTAFLDLSRKPPAPAPAWTSAESQEFIEAPAGPPTYLPDNSHSQYQVNLRHLERLRLVTRTFSEEHDATLQKIMNSLRDTVPGKVATPDLQDTSENELCPSDLQSASITQLTDFSTTNAAGNKNKMATVIPEESRRAITAVDEGNIPGTQFSTADAWEETSRRGEVSFEDHATGVVPLEYEAEYAEYVTSNSNVRKSLAAGNDLALETLEMEAKRIKQEARDVMKFKAHWKTKKPQPLRMATAATLGSAGRRFMSVFYNWSFTRALDMVVSGIVNHPAFDSVCASMIIMNSVLVGASTDYLTDHDKEADVMTVIAYICDCFFLIELLIRMRVAGWDYFKSEDVHWNIFDMSLVGISIIEFVGQMGFGVSGGSIGSAVKTLKLMRVLRIFRVFRFFRELSLLVIMISDSMKPLMWALVMLFIIIYVFSIVFTAAASDHLKENDVLDSKCAFDSKIKWRYGSLPKSIYTLVQAMLGGVSWGEVADPLLDIGWMPVLQFFIYILFTMLAVLNIITGVFVDNAVSTARQEREYLIEKERELREKYLVEMREIFDDMDKDKSGTITLEELREYFEDVRVQTYFHVLGLDAYDTERLFKLLDDDRSGSVEVQEFLDGCLRLKGEARSIDMFSIISQLGDLVPMIQDIQKHLGIGGMKVKRRMASRIEHGALQGVARSF